MFRDNHIMLQLLFITSAHAWFPGFSNLPSWNSEGLLYALLFHAGVTEPLYYWMHRAFHTEALYNSYHAFHHLSVVPEPPTGTNTKQPSSDTALIPVCVNVTIFGRRRELQRSQEQNVLS